MPPAEIPDSPEVAPKDPDSREVQTFDMPKPPAPPPPEREDKSGPKTSSSQWVVLVTLMALVGLIGFYKFWWSPRIEAEQAAAAAAAAFVRPWPERATEALNLTFESASGSELAAAILATFCEDCKQPRLDDLDITPTGSNLLAEVSISWLSADDQPGSLAVLWKSAERKHISTQVILPQGAEPLPPEAGAGIDGIFKDQVLQVLRRNTAEK